MLPIDSQWTEVNVDGETTQKKYFGKFEVKPFLTHGERAAAVRLAEKYMIGIETTVDQRAFLTTLAFLKFHIVTVDADVKWWTNDGLDLHDEAPIYALSEEVKKMQRIPEEEEKAKEAEEKEKTSKKGKKSE